MLLPLLVSVVVCVVLLLVLCCFAVALAAVVLLRCGSLVSLVSADACFGIGLVCLLSLLGLLSQQLAFIEFSNSVDLEYRGIAGVLTCWLAAADCPRLSGALEGCFGVCRFGATAVPRASAYLGLSGAICWDSSSWRISSGQLVIAEEAYAWLLVGSCRWFCFLGLAMLQGVVSLLKHSRSNSSFWGGC
ncbi:hypothetical protein U1Q18_005481 [Sarracenia purpurea var. burkii]